MSADIVYPIAAQTDYPEPAYQAAGGCESDQREPEPHEREDLLVEEVDWQDALYGVRMLTAHPPQLEVAQSDAWEPYLGGQRSSAEYEVADERDAVQVVLGTEKQVEYEQLDGQVQQVDSLSPTNNHTKTTAHLVYAIR